MASRILPPQLLLGAKLAQLGWLKELACSLATLQQFHHVFSHFGHFGLYGDCFFMYLQEAWTRSKTVFQRHHALADHFHLELGALPYIVDTIYAHTVYHIVLFSFLPYITTSVISAVRTSQIVHRPGLIAY